MNNIYLKVPSQLYYNSTPPKNFLSKLCGNFSNQHILVLHNVTKYMRTCKCGRERKRDFGNPLVSTFNNQ